MSKLLLTIMQMPVHTILEMSLSCLRCEVTNSLRADPCSNNSPMQTVLTCRGQGSNTDLTAERKCWTPPIALWPWQERTKWKVCQIVHVPASFKSDVWKHFSFPESRDEKGGKVADRQKQRADAAGLIHTSSIFVAHIVEFQYMLKVQSLKKIR